MKTLIILLAFLFTVYSNVFPQSVGINSTGTSPDGSAMLDIVSTDKGMLIPRVDYASISSKTVTGLVVYITANGPEGNNLFYYFNGNAWHAIANTENLKLSNNNIRIGYSAGASIASGIGNTLIGYETMLNNTNSAGNTTLGYQAGYSNNGTGNIFLGYSAGYNETGSNKLYIANSETTSPLVYGDFSSSQLQVNGRLMSVLTTASNNDIAIYGEHNVTSGYGIGVKGMGAYVGVLGESTLSGGSASTRIGVRGLGSGAGTNIGGYFEASCGSSNECYAVYASAATSGNRFAGYFSGNVTVTGTFSNPSDIRLKTNIEPFENALNKIMQLGGVTYFWKSEKDIESLMSMSKRNDNSTLHKYSFPAGRQFGFIAQEVEKVFPELVQTSVEGFKSVDYIKMGSCVARSN